MNIDDVNGINQMADKYDWLAIGDIDGAESSGLVHHRYVKMFKNVCFSIAVVCKGRTASIMLDMFDLDKGQPQIVCALSHWDMDILERLFSRLDAEAAKKWANNEANREYVLSRNGLVAVETGEGVIRGSGMICARLLANWNEELQEPITGDRETNLVLDSVAKRLPIFVNQVMEALAP